MTERNGVLARSKPLAPRIAKRRATARVAASQRLLAMATLVSFMASLLAGRPARAETLPGATDPIGNGAGGVETLATPLPAANATSELATVDLATGAARSSFPFKLETARGGAQPSLALAYSSSNGVGFAGSGWTLTTPSIVRRGSAGMPQFQDVVLTSPASLVRNKLADEYLMDGQLLVPICSVDGAACGGGESQIPLSSLLANTTREVLPSQVGGVSVDGWAYFRREIDDGRRYFFSPDGRTWIVQDKRGNSQQFGHPLDAFRFGTDGIEVADGGAQVQLGVGPVPYRWNLVRESDASGNTVYYVWANLREASGIVTPVFDNGVRYLTDIYDTESYAFQPCKNGVCPAPRPLHDFAHHVHLRWDARTSTLSRAGVATSPIWRALPALLLTGVDVTSATLTSRARQLVRRYHLGYQLSSDWATLDELASITLEGACTDTGGIVSMPEDGNGLLSLFTECSTLGGATPTLRFAYAPDAPRQDGLPILTVKQKFPYNVPTFDRGAGCGPWAPSPLCGGFSMADVNGDAVADYVYGPLSAEKGNDCHGDIDCAEGQQCLLNNPPFNFSGTCTSPGTPKVFFPGDDIYVDYGPPPASSAGAVAEAPYRLFSGPGFARQAHELQLGPMGTVRPQGASEKTFDRRVFADWLSHGHVDWMWLNLDLEGNRVPGAFEIYTPSQASDGSGTFPLSLDTISTLAHFPARRPSDRLGRRHLAGPSLRSFGRAAICGGRLSEPPRPKRKKPSLRPKSQRRFVCDRKPGRVPGLCQPIVCRYGRRRVGRGRRGDGFGRSAFFECRNGPRQWQLRFGSRWGEPRSLRPGGGAHRLHRRRWVSDHDAGRLEWRRSGRLCADQSRSSSGLPAHSYRDERL